MSADVVAVTVAVKPDWGDQIRVVWRLFSLVRGGAPGRTRTCDLGIRSPLLYPLSYERVLRQKVTARDGSPGERRG
jgi:hypothetical protein